MHFEGLTIEYDDRVLEPRPWTAQQSRWAAELIGTAPPGPVLELCSGAGHIGLLAVTLAPRLAGLRGRRRGRLRVPSPERRPAPGSGPTSAKGRWSEALGPEERFAVIIADPPWVSTAHVARYPEDPVTAIDGGSDGLDLVRMCLDVIEGHLAPAGSALLQIGPTRSVLSRISWRDVRRSRRGRCGPSTAARSSALDRVSVS